MRRFITGKLAFVLPAIIVFSASLVSAGPEKHKHKPPEEGSPVSRMMIDRAEGKVGAPIPGDLTVINQDGKEIALSTLFDKPLIVSFIYTNCPNICPAVTANLGVAIQKSRKLYGDAFRALSISFDVDKDTPELMKTYGGNFRQDSDSWIFAVAKKETVSQLTDAFGFVYIPSPDGSFNHTTMVSIVHKGGALIHHVYGVDFSEEQFVKVLKILLEDIKEKK
ncbi:hypothetical protein MNBD_NITROSPINAE02-2004 [hydrothermal vent metagenome]|uniref:Thioredoxin domain-containing protein n=1 Tax=hydrothermal vent metagenome TaxID=652676 RepID=A0A3B1CKU2_9ZZZZ